MSKSRLALLSGVVLALALVVVLKAEVKPPTGEAKSAKAAVLPVMMDFGAGTCSACKAEAPVLDQLRTRLTGKVTIRYVDIASEASELDKWSVKAIPTQIFVDPKGKELWRHVGYLRFEDALAKMKKLGWIS